MKRWTIKCSVVNVSGWRRKRWGGRCQGGERSDRVEDVRVEKEATEWKIKMRRVSWASSLRSVSFLPADQP